MSLDDLAQALEKAEKIAYHCPECGIFPAHPVKFSPMKEPTEVRLAIVGDAPSELESSRKMPFSDYAGQLMKTTLNVLGFKIDEIYYTHVCCCHPPGNRTIETAEIEHARYRLHKELEAFRPDRILLMGNVALQGLLGASLKVTKERGAWSFWAGIPVMTTLHPGALLRMQSSYLDFYHDLEKFKEGPVSKTIFGGDVDDHYTRVAEDEEEALRMLQNLHPSLSEDWIRAIDIETTGFSPENDKVLCIGITRDGEEIDIFPREILTRKVLNAFEELFSYAHLEWVGHNAINFDADFLRHNLETQLDVDISWDTMLMHYLVDERRGTHGLKLLGRNYFALPDWEADIKKYVLGESATYEDIPRKELYRYLGYDVAVTYHLYFQLKKAMEDEPCTFKAYENILKPSAVILAEVEKHGCWIDVPYLQELDTQWQTLIDANVIRLQELAENKGLNIRSPKQVAELLFDDLGMEEVEGRSTSKKVLGKLGLKDETGVIELVLETRALAQNKSTYVVGLQKKVGSDSRIRTHLLLHGTETGRLASQRPNLMNIPKHRGVEIRKAFVADDGYTFLEADYSQLEFRVAAWYSQDSKLIDAFVSGHDFHRAVASQVLGKPPEEVTKEERFMAKFINFGILYGRGAKSLAEEELKCSVRKAQQFIDNFLGAFPAMAAWRLSTIKTALENGYVESAFGRRRHFPLILSGNKFEIEKYAVNTPIQGMASDICLLALGRIHREIPQEIARVMWPVHDSILIQVKEEYLEEVQAKVKFLMEDPPLEKRLPFTVEMATGKRWSDTSED